MKAGERLSFRIAELRKAKKLTQAELAQKIGVTRAAISQFEKGNSTPSFQTLVKLSAALELDLTGLLPRIGKYPILGAEGNIEVPIILGNQYDRLRWDYLRRDDNEFPSEEEEAAFALSNTSYAFESLSLPKSMLLEGKHIAFPVPNNTMEPTFGEDDLLILTLLENVDWSAFPFHSNNFDDIDTFPVCAVEGRSEREFFIEFGRFGVDLKKQRLWCYYDDRNHHSRCIELAHVKHVWKFTWSLSKRAQNPAQQLVYQVAKLQHDLEVAKTTAAAVEGNLAQANAVIGNLLSQLPKTESVDAPQPTQQ